MRGGLEEWIGMMYFMQSVDGHLLKSHLLNALCALGLKALNDSHHSEDSFLQTE